MPTPRIKRERTSIRRWNRLAGECRTTRAQISGQAGEWYFETFHSKVVTALRTICCIWMEKPLG